MHLRAAAARPPPPPPPVNLLPLSSTSSYTSIPLRRRGGAVLRAGRLPAAGGGGHVRCSISQVHSYGTVDYDRRPALKWSSLYRRISMIDDPTVGPAAVLDRWEEEERRLVKWDVCRVIKELRKFRRYHFALEVYGWMSAQEDRFKFTSSDMAIKLDLIAKVHGIISAEEHFSNLPDILKDKRTYGALLNAYGQAKMKEKAEATLEILRTSGYATDALPFNVMMTLYMNIGEHEKINMIISEMQEKHVAFDVFSYNIWITNCAAVEDVDEMERVVDQMTLDRNTNANWTTYTTLATMYIKLGNYEKAYDCLKSAEIRMTCRDRTPFNYLLGLYSTLGKKEELYQTWSRYKSSFPVILNMGYQSMLASLVRLGDIEGAGAIYDEWISTTSNYDPRICNILLGWYSREGHLDNAYNVLDRFLQKGGKPKPSTWEIISEGCIKEKQIYKALTCMKEAASCKGARNWRPNITSMENLLALCKEQNDTASVDTLLDVLRPVPSLECEEYQLLFRTYSGVANGER